jgi:hypothetical protein
VTKHYLTDTFASPHDFVQLVEPAQNETFSPVLIQILNNITTNHTDADGGSDDYHGNVSVDYHDDGFYAPSGGKKNAKTKTSKTEGGKGGDKKRAKSDEESAAVDTEPKRSGKGKKAAKSDEGASLQSKTMEKKSKTSSGKGIGDLKYVSDKDEKKNSDASESSAAKGSKNKNRLITKTDSSKNGKSDRLDKEEQIGAVESDRSDGGSGGKGKNKRKKKERESDKKDKLSKPAYRYTRYRTL